MNKNFQLSVSLVLATLITYMCVLHTANAEETVTLKGQVVNRSTGGEIPAGLNVALHIFRPVEAIATMTTVTNSDGTFFFDQVPKDASARYVLSTTYQDVTYSVEAEFALGPTTLEVFDITENLSSLNIDSHISVIRNVNRKKGEISAVDIVLITNQQSLTFRPVLDPPSKMNFLRFSVPPQTSTLEVQSDLQGGDIIDVGTGFGLTSPVPPGSHQITFTYSFPYNEGRLSFSRSFPQGSGSFRVLIPESLGEVSGPDLLEIESAVVGEMSYRIWESQNLPPRTTLLIELTNLPQPSLWERMSTGFSSGQAFRIGTPSALGLGLLAILIYALLSRRATPLLAPTADPYPSAPLSRATNALIEEVAQLDTLFEEEQLTEPDYRQRRAELKQRLIETTKPRILGSEGKYL